MKVKGDTSVPVLRDRAYALLQDPVILARCMPGCESLERVGENEYALRLKVVLASISGQFSGSIRIADQAPPSSFRLIVEAKGKIGFLKGDGLLNLAEANGATPVHFDGEVHVGGTIAAVGQRLLDGTAKMLIKKFFDKLAVEAAKATPATQAGTVSK